MPRKTDLRHQRLHRTVTDIGKRTTIPAPKIDHLVFKVMDVTPEQATLWLEGKCPNRNVSDSVVNKYARDMLAGSWHLNGETIAFSTEGALLNGQHRLWAVVQSGATVKMSVAFGVPEESMVTYDMGRNRTFGDVLAIKGLRNTNTLAGAARWQFWYDNIRHGQTVGRASQASHDELMETINKHPLLMSAAALVDAKTKAAWYVSKSILAFVICGALEVNPEKAQEFLEKLADGTDLSADSSIRRLRDRMTADRGAKTKLDRMVVAAYAIKAWNYFLRGRPMGNLKWERDNPKRTEAFPTFAE